MVILQTKHGEIDVEAFSRYINKKKNDIYKLLPLYEESGKWKEHLDTICIELGGAIKLFPQSYEIIEVCAKLEALKEISEFMVFRKTIFETLSLLDRLEAKSNGRL